MNGSKRIAKWQNLQCSGIVREDIQEIPESIFNVEYRQAIELVKRILEETESEDTSKNGKIYNVIPFIGDRGTGKTSAMLTFFDALQQYNAVNSHQSFLSLGDVSFITLQYIDASGLKSTEDAMAIILARMLKYLMDIVARERAVRMQEEVRELYKRFDRIYQNLLNLHDGTRQSLDGESALRALRDLSSSYSIQEDFRELVDRYLRYIQYTKKDQKRLFLVIALDDIDMYQADKTKKNAYTLLEQIYEYLMIPGIIVLATYNEIQLKANCEIMLMEQFDRKSELVRTILLQFLTKILPSYRRIYMPNFERVGPYPDNDLYIVNDRYENGIRLKQFILRQIVEKLGIYYDMCGKKKHFLEFRNLRAVSDFSRFLESIPASNQQRGQDLIPEQELVQKNQNYTRMLSYFYNTFASDLLTGTEAAYFKKLTEVPIDRRGRDLIEYIREKRTKIDENSKYFYSASKKDKWKYSYGELLYNLYCATRCPDENTDHTIFSKEFVYCILGSYTVALNQVYYNYRYLLQQNKRSREDNIFKGMLLDVIGSSISGSWSNEMLPEITSGTLITGKIGSVNIDILSLLFVLEIPILFIENITKEDIEVLKEDLNQKDENFEKEYLHSLELLGMFFTHINFPKNNIEQFPFQFANKVYDAPENSTMLWLQLDANHACFNILNFVVNSFFWEDYFDALHHGFMQAICDYKRLDQSSEEGISVIKRLENFLETYSLKKEYEKWDSDYGCQVIPITHFDMTYNILKRQVTDMEESRQNDQPLKDVMKCCDKVYDNIMEKLAKQDSYYNDDENKHFERIFNECPFIKHFKKYKDKESSVFVNWFNTVAERLLTISSEYRRLVIPRLPRSPIVNMDDTSNPQPTDEP